MDRHVAYGVRAGGVHVLRSGYRQVAYSHALLLGRHTMAKDMLRPYNLTLTSPDAAACGAVLSTLFTLPYGPNIF